MMTLPDFVRHFYPDLTIEKARQMLQDILNVVLYKGNRYNAGFFYSDTPFYDPNSLARYNDVRGRESVGVL